MDGSEKNTTTTTTNNNININTVNFCRDGISRYIRVNYALCHYANKPINQLVKSGHQITQKKTYPAITKNTYCYYYYN